MYEEYDAQAFTWFNLVRSLTLHLGQSWFTDYPMTNASEIRQQIPELEAVKDVWPFADAWNFAKMFSSADLPFESWCSPSTTGTPVEWRTSELGKRALAALDRLGVTYDFDSPYLLAAILPSPAAPVTGLGMVVQMSSGETVLQFGSYVLVADVDLLGENTLAMQQSTWINLPAVLQAASHLAETPFPSTSWMGQVSDRASAFGLEAADRHLAPRPYIGVAPNQRIIYPSSYPGEPVLVVYRDVKCAVELGYALSSALNDVQLDQVLGTVLQVFPKVHTMLLDGRRDGEAQTQAPFQDVLAAGEVFGYQYATVIEDANLEWSTEAPVETTVSGPATPKNFCTGCGTPAAVGARFCGNCGSAL